MAGCGLERDGRRSTCAACGHEYQRGAAAAARRRGPRPPPPLPRRRARACARRRRASARARGRRGSSLLSERGFLASRRRRREAARSRASWRCPEHRLPASIACARQTSWGGCSSRAAVGRGLLGCLSGSFQGRSQVDALHKPRTAFKAPPMNRSAWSLPTSPRALQRQMRRARDHANKKRPARGGNKKSTTQILSPPSPTSAP